MKIWIDGQLYDRENARISVFDHGLLYGDGLFEGIRIYSGKAFMLDEHLERLYQGAAAIRLALPMDIGALRTAVLDTMKVNDSDATYIRILATRGVGPLGISPAGCTPSLIIIVDKIRLYPEECYTEGVCLATSSIRRVPADCWDVRIKSLNYLNNVLAKMQASDAGCNEAVICNVSGRVAECAGDNIFIVRNERVITPPVVEGALDGITRRAVLRLAADLEIPAVEHPLTTFDLYSAEECFLTGSAAEVVPVRAVDNRKIRNCPGPVTRELLRAFRELVLR